MKVADLFAALSMKVDRSSFQTARAEMGRFAKASASTGAAIGSSLVKPFKALGSGLLSGGGIAGLVGVGGISYGLVEAGKSAVAFEDALVDLQISSQHSIGTTDDFRKRVLAASDATGVAKEQVFDIARQFVSLTGDGKAAVNSMESFARIMVAARAPAEDVAAAAAALNQQLQIKPGDMEKAFSVLSTAGKLGKVELKEFAGLFASIGASYKNFGDSQSIHGLATVASSMQFIAQNFGSSSEAATGLEALMASLTRNAVKLKDVGVDIYDPVTGQQRGFLEIIEEINAKRFNATQIGEVLGNRQEAVAAFRAVSDNLQAWKEQIALIEKANNITEDYQERQTTAAARISKSWNSAKNRIYEAFTPERIEAFTSAIEAAVGAAAALINSLSAVGDWVAELAGAKTPAVIKNIDSAIDELGKKGFSLEQLANPDFYTRVAIGSQNPAVAEMLPEQARQRLGERNLGRAADEATLTLLRTQAVDFLRDAATRPVSANTSTTASVSIVVNPSPGMDEKKLGEHVADHVDRKLKQHLRTANAAHGGR